MTGYQEVNWFVGLTMQPIVNSHHLTAIIYELLTARIEHLSIFICHLAKPLNLIATHQAHL